MSNIIPFPKVPSSSEAEKIIKQLVTQGKFSWSEHCKQRMKERKITTPEIINCLLKGRITETPFFSHANGGGYETRMEKGTAGDWLRVVVCLKLSQKLLVITVINK